MADWRFYRHMPVFDRGGRRLGRVEEVGHSMDYLHVQQGRLLVRDWYVPFSAIRDVTETRVALDVDRTAMIEQRWNVPPEEYLLRQGATPGYEYTSPADNPSRQETETTIPIGEG